MGENDNWDAYVGQQRGLRLIFAARHVTSDAVDNADAGDRMRLTRAHHLRVEQLLQDAGGERLSAWDVKVAYRGDTIIVSARDDSDGEHLHAFAVAAWRMVDENPTTDLEEPLGTTIGLCKDRAIEVGGFRHGLGDGWPATTDLRGRGVQRALGLVRDVGAEGQVLMADRFLDAFVKDRLAAEVGSSVSLQPLRKDARAARDDLGEVSVAQLSWGKAKPGTLTNRHLLGDQLKGLQPLVQDLAGLYKQIDGTVVTAYSGEAGTASVAKLEDAIINTSRESVDDLTAAWDRATECHGLPKLAELVKKVAKDHEKFSDQFRDLQDTYGRDDSGRRETVRQLLQGEWQECRDTPQTLLDEIGKDVNWFFLR